MKTTKTKWPAAQPDRRRKAEEKRIQKQLEEQHAKEQFEANRNSIWTRLWAKAMRIELLVRDNPMFYEQYGWWFYEFKVNADAQSFKLDERGVDGELTEETLSFDMYETTEYALDSVISWYNDFRDKQERLRREAEELKQKRLNAISKLSDEDLIVLGLSKVV